MILFCVCVRVCVCVCIHYFSDSFLLQVITRHCNIVLCAVQQVFVVNLFYIY